MSSTVRQWLHLSNLRYVVPASPLVPQTPPGPCRIKGNISENGKLYHVPGSRSYDSTIIDESKRERWFCSEQEAKDAGWRKAG